MRPYNITYDWYSWSVVRASVDSFDEDRVDGAVLPGAIRDLRLTGAGLDDGTLGQDVTAHEVAVCRALDHILDRGGRILLRLRVEDVRVVPLEKSHLAVAAFCRYLRLTGAPELRERGITTDHVRAL